MLADTPTNSVRFLVLGTAHAVENDVDRALALCLPLSAFHLENDMVMKAWALEPDRGGCWFSAWCCLMLASLYNCLKLSFLICKNGDVNTLEVFFCFCFCFFFFLVRIK